MNTFHCQVGRFFCSDSRYVDRGSSGVVGPWNFRSGVTLRFVLSGLILIGGNTKADAEAKLSTVLNQRSPGAIVEATDASPRSCCGVATGQELLVEIGDRDRIDVPVSFDLSLAKTPWEELIRENRLVETTGGQEVPIPSQLEMISPPRLWWILKGQTPAQSKRTFRIDKGAAVAGTGILVEQNPKFLELRRGETPVLRYNKAHVEPPAGIHPQYGRSGHIHPVWTPSGVVVTEQFPADHAHQSGVFLAYVKTEFEGRAPDFWNLRGGTGRVKFKGVNGTSSGPVFGELHVMQEHVDLSSPEEKVALIETWKVRVWNVGGKELGYSICDLTSHLKCATESPLKLAHYHYGGMALRGAGTWGGDHAHFLTSEGKDRKMGNHSRPNWCDLSGLVGEKTAGLAIMTHPKNAGFPEPLRIHPTMPYMVYTPSQLGGWEIVPGKGHVSCYRFLIHDGELENASLNRIWSDFGEPLEAKVVP